MSATANAVFPLQQPTDAATDFQTIKFIVDSILSHVRTAQSVRVINVTGGGLGPIGNAWLLPLLTTYTLPLLSSESCVGVEIATGVEFVLATTDTAPNAVMRTTRLLPVSEI